MDMLSITSTARDTLATVTGKVFESVSYCRQDGDVWLVGIEIIDNKARISDNDIIAEYEVVIDAASGGLKSYARRRRYQRAQGAADAA